MTYMKEKEFLQIHEAFLRSHPEKYTKWFVNAPLSGRFRRFLSAIRPLKWTSVLDVCGAYGEFASYMHAVEGRHFEYTCLDFNPHRVKCGPHYLEIFGLKGNFILHNIREPFPLPEEEFDMVWLFGWCDTLFDCYKLFNEIYRVLEDNGIFMFNMAYAGYYKTKYSEAPLRELMKKTSFEVLRLNKIDSQEYGVVAKKLVKTRIGENEENENPMANNGFQPD